MHGMRADEAAIRSDSEPSAGNLPRRVWEILKIILVSIFAAVSYGVLHDQITARVCVEYFTIGHPPVFDTQSPALLALGWGVIATWWAGAILGFPLALVAQLGRMPRLSARELSRPIGVLLIVMACSALVSGIAGYWAARSGHLFLRGSLALEIPEARHAAFLADAAAHLASYGVGFFGGFVVWGWVVIRRWRLLLKEKLAQVARGQYPVEP
jgi:hypothetical protein